MSYVFAELDGSMEALTKCELAANCHAPESEQASSQGQPVGQDGISVCCSSAAVQVVGNQHPVNLATRPPRPIGDLAYWSK